MLDIFQSGLQSTLAIIVALGILVGIHEWGHFIVARLCGVKVLKFSIGFGQSIYSWVDKKDTEFVIAWIPLGGFVKMVDEREGEVAEQDLDKAFNRKPVLQRIAIVAAGPFVNLLFATLVYWIVFMGGQQVLAPIVGSVATGSVAETAGLEIKDEVVAVEGDLVNSWDDVVQLLVLRVLEVGKINIEVRDVSGQKLIRTFDLEKPLRLDENTDPLAALGIRPAQPEVPAIVGDLVEGEAGSRDGLQIGDEILAVNDQAIADWMDWVDAIKVNAGIAMKVDLERKGHLVEIQLTPNRKEGAAGEVYGFVGVGAAAFEWPEHLLRNIEYNPMEAFHYALKKTWDSSVLILVSTWKLAVGDLARDNLGGPIMIAKLAGRYADYGMKPYLLFIAYISIVLGVMNLLPIPVLDGGHILFYIIELIIRRPIPEKIQDVLMRGGLTLLLLVMTFAVFNDVTRIFAGSF